MQCEHTVRSGKIYKSYQSYQQCLLSFFSDCSTRVNQTLQTVRAVFQPDGSSLSLPIQMHRYKQSPPLRVADHNRPYRDACFPVRRSLLLTISVSTSTVVNRNGLCNISPGAHGMVSHGC